MGSWCPLDDWEPDGMAKPVSTFVPGSPFPLLWTTSGPRVVEPGSSPIDTWPRVALVTHWATAHPDQLHALIGPFETHPGLVRPPGAFSTP